MIRLIKEWALYALLILIIMSAVLAVVYGFRLFSNASTPITIHHPVDGVTRAAMVTGDGAAIDCWRDGDK